LSGELFSHFRGSSSKLDRVLHWNMLVYPRYPHNYNKTSKHLKPRRCTPPVPSCWARDWLAL
jgi:hypothetical protein